MSMDNQRHNEGQHIQSTLDIRSLFLSQKYGKKAPPKKKFEVSEPKARKNETQKSRPIE